MIYISLFLFKNLLFELKKELGLFKAFDFVETEKNIYVTIVYVYMMILFIVLYLKIILNMMKNKVSRGF
jgi:hypothetical protein